MRLKNLLISVSIFTVGTTFVVPAGFAVAQIPGTGTGMVPVHDDSIQRTLGSAPPLGSEVTDILGQVRGQLTDQCVNIVNGISTQGASAFINSLNPTNFGLINGSETEALFVKGQAMSYSTGLECVNNYLNALQEAPSTTVLNGSNLQREQQTYSSIRDALSQKVDDMNARASSSWKDVLKAIMIRAVLNTSKNLTTEMVNKMVEKYKISDYLAYADAVSTQVYSMKYINENYAGDARQQMMIRSLLQSEKFPEKIKTVQAVANSKAQEYLGTACGVGTPGINPNDQSYFLKCLAAYGAPEASAQYHYLNAVDQAQATKVAANASTQAELAQSSGFAPPRNCDGSLAMQQQIDAQYDTAYQEKDIAVAVADRLKRALASGQTTQAEYDRAQAAADQAIANVNSLNQSGNPIIDICKAIDSPAQFVATSINSYLAKHFEESSQLKSENLPFYANFLSDVASNFLTNILTGGKSTSQVLKEAGVGALNGTVIGLTQAAQGGQTGTGTTGPGGTTTGTVPNPVGSVDIYAQANNGGTLGGRTLNLAPGQAYVITIDFSAIADENPYRVVVSGLGVDGGTNNLTLAPGDLSAKRLEFDYTPGNRSVTLQVTFYAHPFSGDAGDVPIGPYTQVFSASQVAGVATVLPRGPVPSFR